LLFLSKLELWIYNYIEIIENQTKWKPQ